jgi:putative sterol carrier protein
MERAFNPSKAHGFSGDIQYVLSSNGKKWAWIVAVHDGRVSARSGTADAPVVTVSSKLADFARVAAGDLDGARAFLTGKIRIEGDIAAAARLQEMFGRSTQSPW